MFYEKVARWIIVILAISGSSIFAFQTVGIKVGDEWYAVDTPITDRLHDATKGLNTYFQDHLSLLHPLMIVAGLFMDFIVISLFIIYALHGGNKDIFDQKWRLPTELVAFYGLRFVC